MQLDGPLLKLWRAYSEINRLIGAEEAFRRDADYSLVRAERDPKTGEYAYRVRVGQAPDPEWGVFIGEIAHNLRSALDGLVYQLVLDNGETPTNNTQFPIFLVGHTTRMRRTRRGGRALIPHFEGRELADGRSMLNGVSDEHQTKIERLQPYKRSNRHSIAEFGKDNVLYLLKELNNADKHRLIQVVGVKPGAIASGTWQGRGVYDVTGPRHVVLKDGAKVLTAPPEVQVYPKIA
ncbi:MAG: hypothetical protein DRI30_07190, partial [Chloroflexi bacterium]